MIKKKKKLLAVFCMLHNHVLQAEDRADTLTKELVSSRQRLGEAEEEKKLLEVEAVQVYLCFDSSKEIFCLPPSSSSHPPSPHFHH